jgi:hypothetical protein
MARHLEMAGKIPQGTASKIATYNNLDAGNTAEAAEEISRYVNDALPKRVPQLQSGPPTAHGQAFDLSLLGDDPGEWFNKYAGRHPGPAILPVSRKFDLEKMTRSMTPEVVRRMNRLAISGSDVGGRWYNTAPLLKRFEDIVPPEEVWPRFKRFMEIQAAASPRSSPDEQILRGSVEHFRRTQGLPPMTQEQAKALGMGHLAHENQTDLWEQLRHSDHLPKTNEKPKVGSYIQNFLGNTGLGTMDTHQFVAADLYDRMPTIDPETGLWIPTRLPGGDIGLESDVLPWEHLYTPLELTTAAMGLRHGVMPAVEQASVWSGLRGRPDLRSTGKALGPRSGGEFMKIMDDMVARSAQKWDVPLSRHLDDVLLGNTYLRKRRSGGKVAGARPPHGLSALGGAQTMQHIAPPAARPTPYDRGGPVREVRGEIGGPPWGVPPPLEPLILTPIDPRKLRRLVQTGVGMR